MICSDFLNIDIRNYQHNENDLILEYFLQIFLYIMSYTIDLTICMNDLSFKNIKSGIYTTFNIISINTYRLCVKEVTYFIFTYIFDRCQINECLGKTKKKIIFIYCKEKEEKRKSVTKIYRIYYIQGKTNIFKKIFLIYQILIWFQDKFSK